MNKQIDINNLQIITAMPDGLQEWTWAYDKKTGKIYRLVYIGCACTDKENTTVCLTPEELKKEIDEYGKDHPYMIKDYERYLEGQKSE
jgi:hypothetical protein